MYRVRLPYLLILAASVVYGGELAYYSPRLPDPTASHFNAQGQPDGWMPKRKFIGAMAGSWVMLLVLLALPPLVVSRIPAALINLPHKDYWLAPERSAATRQKLTERMAWFSAATMVFLAYIFHGVIHANLRPNPKLDMWQSLVFYFVFVGLWTAEIIWCFARPPKSFDPSARHE